METMASYMQNPLIPDENELTAFLEKIPLFSSIPLPQLHLICGLFKPVFAKKGDFICREGEAGDSMHIIKSGSVGVYVDRDGEEVFVSYLHRADFFGEMSLLTGMARTATVRVILDAHLFELKKEAFEELVRENPSIGLFLSRHYAHRFAQSSFAAFNEPLPTFFAMTSTHPGLGRQHFIYSLAYHLAEEAGKRVLVVELARDGADLLGHVGLFEADCPDPELIRPFSENHARVLEKAWFAHESGFNAFLMPRLADNSYWEELNAHLPHVMDTLRAHYHLVLFNVPERLDPVGKRVFHLCEKALVLINNTPEGWEQTRSVFREITRLCQGRKDNVRVGTSHLIGNTGISRETIRNKMGLVETPAIWVHKCRAADENCIETERRFPVRGSRALAREMGRIRVGLALGAGGARGWAHIGVLKVLEENGVHIDMIAGTSMGALVGAVYAASASWETTKRLTIERFPTRLHTQRHIFDYTLPFHGIIKGQRVHRMLKRGLKDADFLDLLIPTFIVAVDMVSGKQVILETGKVCEAIRASISIPGIFNPYYLDGRWFIDGGLLNPVPVDVLIQKGAGVIIAVCVEHEKGRALENFVKPPSILGVLSRTVHIIHTSATGDFAQQADVVLYPDVNRHGWEDFHKGAVLMEAGEAACREQLPAILELIEKQKEA